MRRGGIGHLIRWIRRCAIRNKFGVGKEDVLCVSVGELNKNKNHEVVIKAVSKIKNKNVKYFIVGTGRLGQKLQLLIQKVNAEEKVRLLGYRTDVSDIYLAADICVFPSIREGLGLAAVEGMAAGLPLIISKNRGAADYARQGINAVMCDCYNEDDFAAAISDLAQNIERRFQLGVQSGYISQRFDVKNVEDIMNNIYMHV